MTAACGNNASKQTEQAAAEVVAVDPTVSVAQVFVREVPQEAVYTSTVQAYVKNNIAPQMAGRITKINVEIGDFVKQGPASPGSAPAPESGGRASASEVTF